MDDFMQEVYESAVKAREHYLKDPHPAVVDVSIMLLETYRGRVADLWLEVFSDMPQIQGTDGPEDPMWEALWKVRFGMTRSEAVNDYIERYGKKE